MYPIVPTEVKGPTSPTDFGAHWHDHFPIAPMVLRMFRTQLSLQSDACEDRGGLQGAKDLGVNRGWVMRALDDKAIFASTWP